MPGKHKQFLPEVEQEMMQQAARLLIAGHTQKEIAEKLGLTRQAIWGWRDGPKKAKFQKILGELQRKISDRADDALLRTVTGQLQAGAEKGLRVMMDILEDDSVSIAVKQRAAADLMDRDERMSKKRTITAKHTHDVIPAELLVMAGATAAALMGRGIPPQQALPAGPREEAVIETELVSEPESLDG
jgi:predicted transcriptional regulator